MTDLLAPNVTRVGTDPKDKAPIGTCWGRDKPEDWGYRLYEGDPWVFDLTPAGKWWVQCRPPASPSDPALTWVVNGNAVIGPVGETVRCYDSRSENEALATAQRIADALNAAESSATRPEPRVTVIHEGHEFTVPRNDTVTLAYLRAQGAEIDGDVPPPPCPDCHGDCGWRPCGSPSSPPLDEEPAVVPPGTDCGAFSGESGVTACVRPPGHAGNHQGYSHDDGVPVWFEQEALDGEPADPPHIVRRLQDKDGYHRDPVSSCCKATVVCFVPGNLGFVALHEYTEKYANPRCGQCNQTLREPDPDVPPSPRPGPGEHLTTAGWVRDHGLAAGWGWRLTSDDVWHIGAIPNQAFLADDVVVLVRRADNEETSE